MSIMDICACNLMNTKFLEIIIFITIIFYYNGYKINSTATIICNGQLVNLTVIVVNCSRKCNPDNAVIVKYSESMSVKMNYLNRGRKFHKYRL